MRAESEKQAVKGFAEAWDSLLLAVRRLQARGQQGKDDLALSQYYLLQPLDGGSRPLCELADCAGIAPPTATRVLDGLEASGLVSRDRSPTDRRTVLISLTPEGHKRLLAKRRWLAQRRQRLYDRLEPAEREQSEQLLRHLAELLGEL
jgi:DNA-binding MarR family transcriptional regulator